MKVQIPYKHTSLALEIPEINTPEVLCPAQHVLSEKTEGLNF